MFFISQFKTYSNLEYRMFCFDYSESKTALAKITEQKFKHNFCRCFFYRLKFVGQFILVKLLVKINQEKFFRSTCAGRVKPA